ncbi:MAG: prepilin peptidase [Verrucomicrobiaceae bacterium]|nr:prepilin peptidase [Verrucomicrobiaceae bacterium]
MLNLYIAFFLEHPAYLIAGCFLLGLIVGSFLNVVIYRLPVMMQREWHSECSLLLNIESPTVSSEPFNLAFPPSRCPGCNSKIAAWQNIPVISYLFLRGRCANCKIAISKRYPIIEMVSGLLAVFTAWQMGFGWPLLATLILLWALLAMTMIDVDHQLLPDQITLPLLWLGLLLNTGGMFVSLNDAIWGAAAGYLSLWSVYHVFKLLTGKEGMGFGDFKLLAALGAWMGWQMLPVIILLSSLVGAVIGSLMLIAQRKGRGTPIPFGPYLAGAGVIAFFWGKLLIQNYLQFVGL